MNGGEVWDMFPEAFRTGVSAVLKRSNSMEYGGTSGSAASATSDRLWLVSYRELVPTIYDGWKNAGGFQALNQEGGQYEFFKGRVTNNYSSNTILANMYRTTSGSRPAGLSGDVWWERSSRPDYTDNFLIMSPGGGPSGYSYYGGYAFFRFALVPAFSFRGPRRICPLPRPLRFGLAGYGKCHTVAGVGSMTSRPPSAVTTLTMVRKLGLPSLSRLL